MFLNNFPHSPQVLYERSHTDIPNFNFSVLFDIINSPLFHAFCHYVCVCMHVIRKFVCIYRLNAF